MINSCNRTYHLNSEKAYLEDGVLDNQMWACRMEGTDESTGLWTLAQLTYIIRCSEQQRDTMSVYL